jgi:hypothetical protein
MSALGQKQTSQHICAMSAIPPIADIVGRNGNVRYVPEADVSRCSKKVGRHAAAGLPEQRPIGGQNDQRCENAAIGSGDR